MHALEFIGMPEARLSIAQAIIYVCESPKSNSVVVAIGKAMHDAKESVDEPVPNHLRDTSYSGAKKLGYGKGYQYAHSHEGNFANMEFLPDKIKGTKFYDPGNNSREEELRKYLRSLWKDKYGY